jgi:hypothetical protein
VCLLLFNKKKYLIIAEEMKEATKNYMAQYASENPDEIEDVAYIFASAMHMIEQASPQDIKKGMSSTGASARAAALNILQNCAMVEISPCSATELISKMYDDAAYDLYNAINDEKLKNMFISKRQHEENKLLAIKIKSATFF